MKKINIKLSIEPLKQTLSYYLSGLYHRIGRHNDFLLARGLAFSFLICILPLILVIFSILGFIVESATIEVRIHDFMINLLPYKDSIEFINQFILKRVEEFSIHKTSAAFVGIIGLFWAASGLFANIRNILNFIYHIKPKKSPVIIKMKDLFMVLVVLIFFLLSIWILPSLEILKNKSVNYPVFRLFQMNFLKNLVFHVISLLITFIILFLMNFFLPSKYPRKKTAALSAFWSMIFWFIAQKLFIIYITYSASLTKVYGTYVFGVIFIFWIYYSSFVFILGTEIGQLYNEKLQEREDSEKRYKGYGIG